MKHYILDFVDDITEDQIQDFAVAHNLTITKTFDHFKHIVLVVGDEAGIDLTAITQSSLVQNFINDSDHDIQLLSTYTLPNDTDPDISFSINDKKNWWKTFSFGQIDFASETLNVKRRGKNVNVYVMDSGIEDTHSEFVGADIVKLYSITGSFDDTVGHGTAIASIISGRTCGLTDATIKVVKIFDPTVATKQSDILAALDAIATDFTSQSSPGIINMSWSIAKNSFIDSRIQSLIDVGAIVVCSAGNSGVPIENVTPASISSALTIGAYNTEFEPCDFSNYTGSSLSLTQNETNRGALDGWAPGIDIWSAGLNDSFYYVSGTSISAAIATCGLAYNFSGALNESQSLHPWANQDAMEIETLSNYLLARKVMLLGPKYGRDRKSTRLNSSHTDISRMPSSA